MAGWLGDATLVGRNGLPSFGSDDYIADLDAANITYIMKKQNLSYLNANKLYYSQVGNEYTRAEKFLEHTSLTTVKKEIFSEVVNSKIIQEHTLTEAEYRSMSPKEAKEYSKQIKDALNDEKDQMERLKKQHQIVIIL